MMTSYVGLVAGWCGAPVGGQSAR